MVALLTSVRDSNKAAAAKIADLSAQLANVPNADSIQTELDNLANQINKDVEHPANHGLGENPKSRRDRRRRQEMFTQQGGKCHWCREPMEMNQLRCTPMGRWKDNPAFASFEHVIPRSHGGQGGRANLVLSHVVCNGKRHIRRWPHDPVYGGPTLRAMFEQAAQKMVR